MRGYAKVGDNYYYAASSENFVTPAVPTGAINGLFTVSDDNGATTKQVYFSNGNLQAVFSSTTAYTWRFAANQYDYIGEATANTTINGNGTVSTRGTVDLFGWSTASNAFGINRSTADVTYSGDFIDWGTNAISNGGNTANQWRTLSRAEWMWLLGPYTTALSSDDPQPGTNCRTSSTVNGTANARYAKAYLFGTTHGLIIFPDSYTHPEGVRTPLTGINDKGNTSWNANQFTSEEWDLMEAAGCVFLPAAGYREGTDLNDVGDDGYYSTSTPYRDNRMYPLHFYDSYIITSNQVRYRAMSVRLVQDAN